MNKKKNTQMCKLNTRIDDEVIITQKEAKYKTNPNKKTEQISNENNKKKQQNH